MTEKDILQSSSHVMSSSDINYSETNQDDVSAMRSNTSTTSSKAEPSHEMNEHRIGHLYLRDMLLGANDALISVFALVTGVFGGGLTAGLIFLAGLSGALAGALSMGIGEFLSTKSQNQVFEGEKRIEIDHIKLFPEYEKSEIVQIYKEKGFEGELLDQIVEHLASTPEQMLKTMMLEEFGYKEEEKRNPFFSMSIMFITFILGSLVPLLPFYLSVIQFIPVNTAFYITITLTAVILFLVGVAKTYYTRGNKLSSGLENSLLGLLAGIITFILGSLITGLLI